jgi:hypothetical protein
MLADQNNTFFDQYEIGYAARRNSHQRSGASWSVGLSTRRPRYAPIRRRSHCGMDQARLLLYGPGSHSHWPDAVSLQYRVPLVVFALSPGTMQRLPGGMFIGWCITGFGIRPGVSAHS